MRICDVHNIPLATNPATAKALMKSLDNNQIVFKTLLNNSFSSHFFVSLKVSEQGDIQDLLMIRIVINFKIKGDEITCENINGNRRQCRL